MSVLLLIAAVVCFCLVAFAAVPAWVLPIGFACFAGSFLVGPVQSIVKK